MESLDRPRLRSLSARRVEHQGSSYVAFEDSLNLFSGSYLIPIETYFAVVRYFDGVATLDQIQAKVEQESGRSLAMADLDHLVRKLDRDLILDGPSLEAHRQAYARLEVRPPALAGRSYPSDQKVLEAELDHYFATGAGRSPEIRGSSRLRGILSPHIDFTRGGFGYASAYRELVENSVADTFVILGVAHQACSHRFALTRKHFQTPLGLARTDREFVGRLADQTGTHLFEDELAHRTEHSIEFQVIFLQHVLKARPDFTIVPILVGSFHDLMTRGVEPIDDPEVASMIGALREAEAASGRKVAYIGGIDLCHVGPEFGDPQIVDDPTLDQIRDFDRAMLDRASAVDPAGWFQTAGEIQNRWRVCGLAATYTMLHAIEPASGRLLHYDQAVNPSRTCCVTFAGMAFVDDRGP